MRSSPSAERAVQAPGSPGFWRALTTQALQKLSTPFFLFSLEPLRQRLSELESISAPVPVRHWFSLKTQPLRPLVRWWREQARPIEVVSEYELQAALAEDFLPERILVNGPAKHTWLHRYPLPGLNVNFDSWREVQTLGRLAKSCRWRIGLRLHTEGEVDAADRRVHNQFGMTFDEASRGARRLMRQGLAIDLVHFHLRSQQPDATAYGRAMQEVVALCRQLGLRPKYFDCGGGWPAPDTWSQDGSSFADGFDRKAIEVDLARICRALPGLEEVWLENGRFLTASSGVLVVQVSDVKSRGEWRCLICDGGRTNHALVSSWERHRLISLPERRGKRVPTSVCGPTCMGFDWLFRGPLPAGIHEGDLLMWLEAGAYHLPWETRFSQGWAGVAWHDGLRVRVVRDPEPFTEWWAQWRDK